MAACRCLAINHQSQSPKITRPVPPHTVRSPESRVHRSQCPHTSSSLDVLNTDADKHRHVQHRPCLPDSLILTPDTEFSNYYHCHATSRDFCTQQPTGNRADLSNANGMCGDLEKFHGCRGAAALSFVMSGLSGRLTTNAPDAPVLVIVQPGHSYPQLSNGPAIASPTYSPPTAGPSMTFHFQHETGCGFR